MSTKPGTLPTWNTGGANRTTPSGGQQVAGFATGDQVPSGWLNWFLYWAFTWIQYLSDGAFTATSGNGASGATSDASAAGVQGTNSGTGGVAVKGTSTTGRAMVADADSAYDALLVSQQGTGVALDVIASGGSNAAVITADAGLAAYMESGGASAVQLVSASSADQATLEVVGGVKLSTGTITSTTAVSKALVQQNTPKVWGLLQCNAGALSVVAGFNIASLALSGTNIDVTLASPLAGTNDGCAIATIGSNSASISLEARLSTTAGVSKISIVGYKAVGGTNVDFSAAGNYLINVVGFGVQ